MGRDRAHELEAERRPVVLRIPDQHRQKHDHRNQRRQKRPGAEQPAPPPVRHQHERDNRRQQHDRGEFRQQRQPCEQACGQPPARIAALVQPHQRPQHRDRAGDHRRVGRDLRHQQPVIQRRFRQQHREDDGARIMRHAPDDVGEQKLRDQHRDDAAEPHAETGVAEDRSAEPDQPGDAGRMIEKGKRALLRPGPVIGLVGAQIEHAGIDQPHRRQRGDQQHNGKPGHVKPRRGAVRFGWLISGGAIVTALSLRQPPECQRAVTEKTSIVVPANAGTHTPRPAEGQERGRLRFGSCGGSWQSVCHHAYR